MTVVTTDNIGIEIAEKLGISTKNLICFKIIFDVNCLVTVKAEYLVDKQALKDTIEILTVLIKKR